MDSRYENQLLQQERELREQNFFKLEIEQTTELKEGMRKIIGSAYIRYQMSIRSSTWKGYTANDQYIHQSYSNQQFQYQQKKLRIKQQLSSIISENNTIDIEPINCMYKIEKNRDQIYAGGVFKHVNSYVSIIESVNDEKTKYLYRDQEGIGLKKFDQIYYNDLLIEEQKNSGQEEGQQSQQQPQQSTFITRHSEHLLKCIIKDIQYYYGYNFKILKIFKKEFACNNDFRISHMWWKAFQERYRLLIEHKRIEQENEKKWKVNVFKYNYFLCCMCLQYNCMAHRNSCGINNNNQNNNDNDNNNKNNVSNGNNSNMSHNYSNNSSWNSHAYLTNDHWTTLFDKNIPKYDLHPDKIQYFLTHYNGSNYTLKYMCSDHSYCYRNPIHRLKSELISVQQFSFDNLNKRWINTLFYFADSFEFLNPCFLTLILNLVTSPQGFKFKCKDINDYLKSTKPQYYSKERIENEIEVYMQCRNKEYLKRISPHPNIIYDNDYIQKKYYFLPEFKSEILNQLKDLSDMLNCNYTPCFHKGICDADNGCQCYRNRDLLEKMQKRIDKLKSIDKKQKKNIKQVLELSFDNHTILSNKFHKDNKNNNNGNDYGDDQDLDEDQDDDNENDSDDPLYLQYQEIIGKFLHECERFCGCPNYCRSKNKKLGCNCLNDMTCQTEKSCMCRSKNRECDPEVCRCFCNRNARTIKKFGLNIDYCTNTQALYNCKPRVVLGKSLVCEGLGLFAGQDFKKNAYIGCYIGEIINEKQGTERQEVQQPQGISYLFMLNKVTDVDSFRYGNKMRYVNHNTGMMANCKVEVIYSKGQNVVRFSANQDIAKGQEIYFDYNRNYKIEWMKGFNECYDKFENEDKKITQNKKIISKFIKS